MGWALPEERDADLVVQALDLACKQLESARAAVSLRPRSPRRIQPVVAISLMVLIGLSFTYANPPEYGLDYEQVINHHKEPTCVPEPPTN